MNRLYTTWESPLGELMVVGDGTSLEQLRLPAEHRPGMDWVHDPRAFEQPIRQLEEYFSGKRTEFELVLSPRGGPFDLAVWEQLRSIPYGETRSYGEIARAIGRPDRARAVGSANARNPLAIVVPCHRVIGADGSLVGYGGGVPAKRALLALESSGTWQATLM